jgi:hypothetical protein
MISVSAPLDLSGLVDLVPAADLPPERALEPVALKTLLQYHLYPLSGSELASIS